MNLLTIQNEPKVEVCFCMWLSASIEVPQASMYL